MLVVETIQFLRADKFHKRVMIEACAQEESGRMFDYGHIKSDSREGRMTRAKLFRLAQMAQRLHDIMLDEDDLPEWVQDKVTTAEDRLQAAHDYITYKIHRMK